MRVHKTLELIRLDVNEIAVFIGHHLADKRIAKWSARVTGKSDVDIGLIAFHALKLTESSFKIFNLLQQIWDVRNPWH